MSERKSKYPSTFYRVSLKAVIRDDQGRVLLVKENDFAWTFPGGGIEHGENEHQALKRELYEEARITQPFTAAPLGIQPIYVEDRDTWVLWIFYDVRIDGSFTHENGDDILEAGYKHPSEFKDSKNKWENYIYTWGTRSSKDYIDSE